MIDNNCDRDQVFLVAPTSPCARFQQGDSRGAHAVFSIGATWNWDATHSGRGQSGWFWVGFRACRHRAQRVAVLMGRRRPVMVTDSPFRVYWTSRWLHSGFVDRRQHSLWPEQRFQANRAVHWGSAL